MRFVALRDQFHRGHLYQPGEMLEVGNNEGVELLDIEGFAFPAEKSKEAAFKCLDIPKGWKPAAERGDGGKE